MKGTRQLLLTAIVSSSVLVFAPGVAGQTPPTLESATFYGGAGDQTGRSIAIQGSEIYIGGWGASPDNGLLLRYGIPPAAPVWTSSLSARSNFQGTAVTPSTVLYAVGCAVPPVCGASDSRGDTEGKTLLARYATASGTLLNCRSENFFPYRGGEYYPAALVADHGSTQAVYAAGRGEEWGWGGFRTILAKYATDGTLLWKRKYATDTSGNNIAGTYTKIGSATNGLTWLNGYAYLAGWDQNAQYVGGTHAKAMLLKYDAAGQPPDSNPGADGAEILYPEWARTAGVGTSFLEVTDLGGYLYAVGNTYTPSVPGTKDYLVQKYDQAGNLVWSRIFGGASDDQLYGVVGIGGRLFVVGSTRSQGAGAQDIVVMEIDPSNGDVLSTTLYGGALDDIARRAATDGTDLYVVGESRSFTEGGNGAGENDLVLLRYSITPTNQPPVAEAGPDQTVECTTHSGASVTLDGSGSSDPDSDPLTYTWTGPFPEGSGTATGVSPTVTLAQGGPYTITLTVDDGNGATDSDTVDVTVDDKLPPMLQLTNTSVTVVLPTATATGAVVDVLAASDASATDECDPSPDIAHSGLPEFPIGSTLVTITATDDCGNYDQRQFTVQVVYNFIGFLPPIRNDGSSRFKAGRTIPIKFHLTAADGSYVTNASPTLEVYYVTGEVLGTVDVESSGEANEDNNFRYDPESDQYLYNLSTKGFSTGTYLLRVSLNDQTTHEVQVSIR